VIQGTCSCSTSGIAFLITGILDIGCNAFNYRKIIIFIYKQGILRKINGLFAQDVGFGRAKSSLLLGHKIPAA
jgi:hypothetical protein